MSVDYNQHTEIDDKNLESALDQSQLFSSKDGSFWITCNQVEKDVENYVQSLNKHEEVYSEPANLENSLNLVKDVLGKSCPPHDVVPLV